MFFETPLIVGTCGLRIDVYLATCFGVLEQSGVVEVEIQFGRIENLEQQHFVSPRPQMGQTALQRIDGRQQIGDEHQHAAAGNAFGNLLQRCIEIGRFAGDLLFERDH